MKAIKFPDSAMVLTSSAYSVLNHKKLLRRQCSITLSIFYKIHYENKTRVALKFLLESYGSRVAPVFFEIRF